VPNSSGIFSEADFNFSAINCRGKKVPKSSSKTIVTTDKPNFEIDRISVTPGKLAISNSTGYVINCSTSWVDKFRDVVIT